MKISLGDFEALAARALERLPREFREALVNVSIEVKERPGREAAGMGTDLLGLYVGPTKAEVSTVTGDPPLPGRIILYKANLEAECGSLKELGREVETTLRHEIAHYLGIDDERLEEIWPEGA